MDLEPFRQLDADAIEVAVDIAKGQDALTLDSYGEADTTVSNPLPAPMLR